MGINTYHSLVLRRSLRARERKIPYCMQRTKIWAGPGNEATRTIQTNKQFSLLTVSLGLAALAPINLVSLKKLYIFLFSIFSSVVISLTLSSRDTIYSSESILMSCSDCHWLESIRPPLLLYCLCYERTLKTRAKAHFCMYDRHLIRMPCPHERKKVPPAKDMSLINFSLRTV